MVEIASMTMQPAAAGDLVLPGLAGSRRTNTVSGFPPEAFEEEFVSGRLVGHRRIILNSPAAIRHVLIDNPDNYRRFATSIRLLYPVTGSGLLLAEGADWREQRRKVAPAFAPRTIPMLARHVATAADAEVAALAAGPREVDLLTRMQQLALDIAGRSMFSREMSGLGPRMLELLRGYEGTLGRPSLFDLLLPLAVPTWRDLRRRRFRRKWLALVEEIIDARRAQTTDGAPRDLLDLLATDPETGAPVPRPRLADQVATMIAAGHATTAVTLFWSLLLVAAAPIVQERIAAEVEGLDLGPEGAPAALNRLAYTRAVVQETLRLYPPAYAIIRQARAADNAGGVPVPARAIINVSPWVLHRHRRLWHDPDGFDPVRFLADKPAPDRFAYLPFGVGPRICIGAQFAMTEAVLVLARLIQAFGFERTDDTVVSPVASILTEPSHAPPFRLQPRKAR
ncbi:MAG TPA: cytochrome P450 [Stellaceae bacterium]|nr:cytochrome P450 [Stellaceae bacterium]